MPPTRAAKPETRPSDRRRRRVLSLVLLGVVVGSVPDALGREAVPQDLEVEVVYADEPGPVGLLEDLSRAVVDAIADKGCFRGVSAAGAGAGARADKAIRCRVVVGKTQEETVHDISLARQETSRDPGDVLRVTAVMAADVRLEILAPGGSVPLRSRRFHVEERIRPRALDEDARDTARRAAVELVAERARGFACRLRPKDLPDAGRVGSR